MAEEKDANFRVVDRRLFTAEGELREEAVAERRQEEKSAPAKPAAKEPAAAPAAGPAEEAVKPHPGFGIVVEVVARNAVALLGGIADPRTGQPLVDLEGAREMIDALDALREKTLGRLTQDEEQMLLDVIGSLKVSFLEMSKAAAAAARRADAASRGEKSPGKA